MEEFFKKYIKEKKEDISDAISLLDYCANRLAVIRDLLLNGDAESALHDNCTDDRVIKGMARILGDIEDDLRLIVHSKIEEMETNRKQAGQRNAQTSGKKEEAQVNP